MTTLTDIFTAYGPEYLEQYPPLPASHRHVIEAIIHCRTGEYGFAISQGQSGGQIHTVHRSCGNRHCPQCPYHKTPQGLDKHMARQLPGPHFLITFTVPEALRDGIRSQQRVCDNALFQASEEALKCLATDERFIGTDLPGCPGILPTWGRQWQYHPPIHDLVPGGGLSTDRSSWLPSRTDFSVPVKALSAICRAQCKEARKKAGLLDQIDSPVWEIDWNVNSHAVGNGSTSLKYLAPSVCKVALSNSRIVSLQDHSVTCTYRKPGSARYRTMSLDVFECIRRFLQPVLPPGFMTVRHFGCMSATCSIPTEAIRQMILQHSSAPLAQPPAPTDSPSGLYCPDCGGPLLLVKWIGPVWWDTS